MRIEPSTVNAGWFTVHVDADELMCDTSTLPYPTCIGCVRPPGRINVWTPAASKPSGYLRAARAYMEAARDTLRKEGKVR